MVKFPLRFDSGIMRGRFRPQDGQLYVCGLKGWQTAGAKDGAVQRVRYTGKPVHLPVGLRAKTGGMTLTFSGTLDPKAAGDPKNYTVKTWSLKRSAAYGSKHHDEKAVPVTAAKVSPDGKTVTLEIAGLAPTWCMEIRYAIRGADGAPVEGVVHNTVHRLGE